MSLNFVGRRYGQFTILLFNGTQYQCQCTCGEIEHVNVGFTKPTYKGRRMCSVCAGSPCQVCGTNIPAKPGHRPATCSAACAAQHLKNRGRDYYERVKETLEYKVMHARSVDSYNYKMQSDAEFSAEWRAYYTQMNFLQRTKINSDPVSRENYLAEKRRHYWAWRARIEADPMGIETLKYKSHALVSRTVKDRLPELSG